MAYSIWRLWADTSTATSINATVVRQRPPDKRKAEQTCMFLRYLQMPHLWEHTTKANFLEMAS